MTIVVREENSLAWESLHFETCLFWYLAVNYAASNVCALGKRVLWIPGALWLVRWMDGRRLEMSWKNVHEEIVPAPTSSASTLDFRKVLQVRKDRSSNSRAGESYGAVLQHDESPLAWQVSTCEAEDPISSARPTCRLCAP